MNIFINSEKFEIIKELGHGGNGRVYQVLNKKDNKYYAIKRIPIENLTEDEINIIINEAKILSTIDDIHIIKYYGSYKDKEYFNILMEYCEGSDLKKLIIEYKNKNQLISEEIIYPIILDICLGIKEIHKKNIIHRDLKPENLFITKENKVKIGDFGICKQLDSNSEYANTHVGTKKYMAPEVIKGESYNKKVDIWAFGCIIYELFTLKVCFESKSLFGYVDNIINKPHGKINMEKYNSKWQELIDLLLKKKYNERPDIDKIYELIININKDNNSKFKGKIMRRLTIDDDEFDLFEEEIIGMRSKIRLFNIIFLKYSIYCRSYFCRKNIFL